RRRGHRQKPRRLLSAGVEMLPPGIGRRREQAAGLPLEGDLPVLLVPDRRRAAAFEHEIDFLEQIALRRDALARRDLQHIGVVDVAGADQVQVNAARALPWPWRELKLAQVLDIEL